MENYFLKTGVKGNDRAPKLRTLVCKHRGSASEAMGTAVVPARPSAPLLPPLQMQTENLPLQNHVVFMSEGLRPPSVATNSPGQMLAAFGSESVPQ